MQKVAQLTNVLIVVSCLILAASYFLPAEGTWAPVDAWDGYYVGDEFVTGFNVVLIAALPFGGCVATHSGASYAASAVCLWGDFA